MAALAGVLAALALGAGAATAATPQPLPGWPRAVPAGPILDGPQSGTSVTVVAQDGANRFTVSAYRADGRRLWRNRRTAGCGNCNDGPQPERRWPDGTYGPIGVEGDDFWSLDRAGRLLRPGCSGVVLADGTCFSAGPGPGAGSPTEAPTITATRGGVVIWRASAGEYEWYGEYDVPPVVVEDGSGRLYAAFRMPREVTSGAYVPGLLIAVDPRSGSILWTRVGPVGALVGLAYGVFAERAGGVIAIGGAGEDLWTRAVPLSQRVTPASVALDSGRDRLYLGRVYSGHAGVTAINARTGAQIWRTRPRDRARLLSVGSSGRVYVAIDHAGQTAVRALRIADGATAWQRRTNVAVLGALELRDRTVAVSAASTRFSGGSGGRLTILDPRPLTP